MLKSLWGVLSIISSFDSIHKSLLVMHLYDGFVVIDKSQVVGLIQDFVIG